MLRSRRRVHQKIRGHEDTCYLADEKEIELDSDGRIPDGTEIVGNDELTPAGTAYHMSVYDCRLGYLKQYSGWIRITGDEPIDLSAIEREQHADIIDTTPLLKPRREPPSPRKPGTNCLGFFTGSINCPENTGCCTLKPYGTFGVFAFTLPFPATVNYDSIFVAGVRRGRHVEVGLFDVSGNKVCSALIDTDHTGVRTGEFDDAVNLVPGDYFLGWASDAEIEVHSLGEGYADQLALMNAGGGAVVAGVGQSRDNALPDKLGVITPGLPSAPILAYFKG